MNIQTLQLRFAKSSLLAFVGLIIIALVASAVIIAPRASAETNKSAPDTKTGYLLLYGQAPSTTRAAIFSTGTGKCSGKTLTGDKSLIVGISKAKNKQGKSTAAKIKCTAGSYNVYFLRKGEKITDQNTKATLKYVATTVNDNYCAFVHTYGTTRNEQVVNKRCVGDDDPNSDTAEKVTPAMTVSSDPATITQGKKYTLTVELKRPDGRVMSTEECAGSFTTSQPTGLVKNNSGEYAFKYNSKTKSCQYKQRVSSTNTKKMATGSYTATFKGNRFLNGTSTGYNQTVAAAAAKESTQTVKSGSSSTNANKKAKIKSVKLAKTSPYIVTFTAAVSNLPNCGQNPAGVSVEGFMYEKGSTKPKSIPATKQPLARSPITATPGANGLCNLSVTYTYPPGSKGMSIKHQLVIDSGGKTITKKSGKIKLGQ